VLLGQKEASALGLAALPLAVIAHPLAGLSAEQVAERAAAVTAEVGHILTTPTDELAGEYQDRHYTQPQHVFGSTPQMGAACTDPLSCGDA
jgi:hypothetical protein